MKLNQSDYDKFMTLSNMVGEWSAANFAGKSKFSAFRYVEPLLGIQEEMGELEEAKTLDEVDDAVSDVVIYLADFVYQTGITLYYPVERRPGSSMAQMYRAVLKNSQGIRGYHDDEFFKNELAYWCSLFLWEFCNSVAMDGVNMAFEEFTSKVSKRDWVANPEAGKCE
jgi:hypothetical protein